MAKTLSAALEADIASIRDPTLQLRTEMSHASMKREAERIIELLDEIPQLFESEESMRTALLLPRTRLQKLQAIRARYGSDARFVGWK
jgi:hypothetical protein